MGEMFSGRKRIRKYFGKIREVAEMPNLIEVQKSSYDLFLGGGSGPQPLLIDLHGLDDTARKLYVALILGGVAPRHSQVDT